MSQSDIDFWFFAFFVVYAAVQLTALANAQRRVAAALERLASLAERRW